MTAYKDRKNNPCFERTIAGAYRRIKPDPIPEPTADQQERRQKLKAARKEIGRVEKIQAARLAEADFLYAMEPSGTESLLKLPPGLAPKLRRTGAYKSRLHGLQFKMNGGAEREIQKQHEKLRMAMSEMVPRALEVLLKNLQSDDESIQLGAAREILDRDGRMPKVSRVQQQTPPPSRIPDASEDILDELKRVPKTAVN